MSKDQTAKLRVAPDSLVATLELVKQKCIALFDAMAADLSRVLIGHKDAVLCPICLKRFERLIDLRGNIDGLSEEHILLDSLGGRETTLTCKTLCNNDLGSKLDSQLEKQARIEHGFQSNEWQRGKIRLRGAEEGDAGAPVNFRLADDGSFHIDATRCNEVVAERLNAFLSRKSAGPERLTMTLDTGISESRVFAAVTKAAYLGLFRDWGYRYILMPSLDRIRRAITDDGLERERLRDIIITGRMNGLQGLPEVPTRISFEAMFAAGLTTAVSIVNLPEHQKTYMVFLPPPSEFRAGGWDGLARAAAAIRGGKQIQFNFTLPATDQIP